MSLPRESGHDDQALVRYLLGLLPDEEAERLDELSLVDDEVAWRLRAVENDLVDEYVNGELEGDMRERFESFYLSSPRRREKVRFAAGLRLAVDRAAAGAPAGPDGAATPGAEPRHSMFSGPAFRMLALAAMLLLTLGTLVFEAAREQRGLRDQLAAANSEVTRLDRRTRDLERQLDEQKAAAPELGRPRDASLAPSVQPPATGRAAGGDAPSPAPQAPSTLAAVALTLLPQTRAAGPVATLSLPRGAERAAFDLQLESSDFPRYQVLLKDPGTGNIVWRSTSITPSVPSEPPTLTVLVPAALLKPQHYSLEVSGVRPDGAVEVVGSYTFNVERST